MVLFDAARAALGIKSKNNNSTGTAGLSAISGAIGGSSNKPVATDHTHGSDSKNQARTDALAARNNSGPKGGDSRFDLGDKNDSFMGKNKNISGMQFGEMNRAGNMIENPPVQTAGAFAPLGTPDSTRREDFDQYGKQFIN